MSAWAKPGVRCVCIAETVDADTGVDMHYLQIDAIYKIVSTKTFARHDGELFLGLWGMPLDTWFDVDAFRPLVESFPDLEQDVAQFKPLLTTPEVA